ncbi:MAG: hypothetical protein M3Q03_19620 [Chloroflexota bacterium]|nr:hypothetical protein [Chloroflexota bacterium]
MTSEHNEREGSVGDTADVQPGRTRDTGRSEVVESGTDPDQERVREVVGRRGYDESDDVADENEEH